MPCLCVHAMVVTEPTTGTTSWCVSPRAETLRPVDGVALASVIVSGVAVITTGGIAVWSARQNATLARETRTQQRLAESYLEVLRLVEREAQWVESKVFASLAVDEEPLGRGEPAVTVVEPAVTDRVTISAYLAAFGTDKVRTLYGVWRSTVSAIENELSFDEPKAEKLHLRENFERKELADAIAR